MATTLMTGTSIWDSSTLSDGSVGNLTVAYDHGEIATQTETRVGIKPGLNPRLYFKYLKKKFKPTEGRIFKKRMELLEEQAEEAEECGQIAMSEQILEKALRAAQENEIYAKGYRLAIDGETIREFIYDVKDGDVNITSLKNYTHPIPKKPACDIKKALAAKVFDDIRIVHYIPEDADDCEEMTEEEKEKDPIAFGVINGSDKFYFITDWEDEYCDLTLDDILDEMCIDRDDIELPDEPESPFDED